MTSPAAPTTGPTPNNMPGAQTAAAPGAGQPAAPAAPAAGPQPPAAPPAQPATVAQPPAADAPKPPWETNGEAFDPERAWNLIQNARRENGELQTKLTAAQPVLDAHEQQRRTEQGELNTVREDLTKANTRGDTWRNRAIRAEAHTLVDGKFVDTEAALALIGDLAAFAAGDDLDVAKLQARVDEIATKHPNLVAAALPSHGFTPNRGQGQSGNAPLTPTQVAAHAESQQDWKTAGRANAQQLVTLQAQQR
ncbi:hypothetical protein BH11ACT6_BH11ACT6_34860 [soil metagenome]